MIEYNKVKSDHQLFADHKISHIGNLIEVIHQNLSSKVIFYNFSEIDDTIFGNYANKFPGSFLFQLRKLNYKLMELASETKNMYLVDLSTVQNQIGKKEMFQSSIYINTEMVLNIDAIPFIAYRTWDLINALNGKFKKCLILDLDNTLWGGVIGDDGIENIQIGQLGIGKAFTEFQYWIKKLKSRGIILAVCSKNTESVAKEPFEKHPEMVLRLEDIAVFVANWDNKADNIRYIQSILNIGFDSMVFLDDNPFERNLVRENIEQITIPELPEDPAEYLEYLYTLNLFETVSHSEEDVERTKLYQVEAQRNTLKEHYVNEDDFLKNLDMISTISAFNNFNIPRVAQLSQRSNQFNLRTVRMTEDDALKFSKSSDYVTFSFGLNDKFGDNGLICVIVLQVKNRDSLFIHSWFMSCRVLKRGMENFTLNTIVDFAKKNNYSTLEAEFIPTAKNEMVKDHYEKLGFIFQHGYWQLDVCNYENKVTFVQANYL